MINLEIMKKTVVVFWFKVPAWKGWEKPWTASVQDSCYPRWDLNLTRPQWNVRSVMAWANMLHCTI